jgi:hypothetical protein
MRTTTYDQCLSGSFLTTQLHRVTLCGSTFNENVRLKSKSWRRVVALDLGSVSTGCGIAIRLGLEVLQR